MLGSTNLDWMEPRGSARVEWSPLTQGPGSLSVCGIREWPRGDPGALSPTCTPVRSKSKSCLALPSLSPRPDLTHPSQPSSTWNISVQIYAWNSSSWEGDLGEAEKVCGVFGRPGPGLGTHGLSPASSHLPHLASLWWRHVNGLPPRAVVSIRERRRPCFLEVADI